MHFLLERNRKANYRANMNDGAKRDLNFTVGSDSSIFNVSCRQQFIMSNLASISFDFSRFSHQGAYFSSYTPQRIEDYLHQPFIPPNSAYHLVACLHPQLMTRSNIDAVVTIYLNASEIIW